MAQDQMMQLLKNFQRQFPREAQKAKVEIQRVIAEGGAPEPEEIQELLRITQELQKNPAVWAEVRPELIENGMPEEMLPPENATKEQLAKLIGILVITVYLIGQGPAAEAPQTAAPVPPPAPDGLIQGGM